MLIEDNKCNARTFWIIIKEANLHTTLSGSPYLTFLYDIYSVLEYKACFINRY